MSETSQMTIVEFLEARIVEDEKQAKAVTNPDIAGTIWCAKNDGALTDNEAREQADYVDRYSTTRALAECAAKRAIIATGNEAALRALANVYADHPANPFRG